MRTGGNTHRGRRASQTSFLSVRVEGGLFSLDFLERLPEAEGQKPKDFGTSGTRSVADEASNIWTDLKVYWEAFKRRLERASSSGESLTTITREQWVIPLLETLAYRPQYQRKAQLIEGRTFPISHRADEREDAPPVHIVACDQELGARPTRGRGIMSPHTLLQEYLNETEHLWGIVTNGKTLRLLRDSSYLTRQAYLEFDLEGMLEGDRFSEFIVFYRLVHRSRLPEGMGDATRCLLEKYHAQAREQGGRIREGLRDAVEETLKILANGFLCHPENTDLREACLSESLTPLEFYQELLRLIYRLLFLMVAEERGLLTDSPAYHQAYSVTRLRKLAETALTARGKYHDLYFGLVTLFHILRKEEFAKYLDLEPLNGELFDELRHLENAKLFNVTLLEAIHHLSYFTPKEEKVRRWINYTALDVEELGSIYESLLELQPVILREGDRPVFSFAQSTQRKSTGSYYTPQDLVQELVKSALEPVIETRLKKAKRIADGEWRIASGEWGVGNGGWEREVIESVRNIISRLRNMEKVDGPGGTGLHPYRELSQNGAVWTDDAGKESRRLDSGKHSGRMEQGNEGISSVPSDRPWEPSGAGNPSNFERESGNKSEGENSPLAGTDRNSWQADIDLAKETPKNPEALREIWLKIPFPIRYSLLAEEALLSLRIVDPACGSGHFLLAAARRLAKELARVRTDTEEPSPEDQREAMREIIRTCIYGVDKNPLAVDLCKVALWIEGHNKGKPLTFLDHHIKCGDSLVGVFDLDVLKKGIPDEAYKPVGGDDKQVAKRLKEENKRERRGNRPLGLALGGEIDLDAIAKNYAAFATLEERRADDVKTKAKLYHQIHGPGTVWERLWKACNLWTAAFFIPMTLDNESLIPTTHTVKTYVKDPKRVDPRVEAHARALAQKHRFFHWPLEFPEVFHGRRVGSREWGIDHSPGPKGRNHSPLATRHSPFPTHHSPLSGFDVVLGNPPWEMMQHEEVQFFATRAPEIAQNRNSAERKKLINKLKETYPPLYEEYLKAKYYQAAINHYIRKSGRFPLTAYGKLNTYSVFAELTLQLTGPEGRAGIIVPTGIATDNSNKQFFSHLIENGLLTSLYDFENIKSIFTAVHRNYKFSLLTLQRSLLVTRLSSSRHSSSFVFFATRVGNLHDQHREFTLTADDIARINPNTGTVPIFRTSYDAELTRKIYHRVPVLVNEKTGENYWNISFKQGLFNTSSDSHLFRTRGELQRNGYQLAGNIFTRGNSDKYFPLYEAKMVSQFDHRHGDYKNLSKKPFSRPLPSPSVEELHNPNFLTTPWYWVHLDDINKKITKWPRSWFLGFRRITRAVDLYSCWFCFLPFVATIDTIPIIISESRSILMALLCGNFNSLVVNYTARQKISGIHLDFFVIKQLPILPPETYTTRHSLFAIPKILELVYTAWDIKPFADDVWKSAASGEWQSEEEEFSTPSFHSQLATHNSPSLNPLQKAILAQWEENRRETGGHSFDLPDWAWAYPEITPADPSILHSPLATPNSPFPTRHSPFPPFKWDENRRALLRAELDAYYAKLYGLTRKQLRYILDPADLTEKELKDILDPWEEVSDPLDPEGYQKRVEASTFPGETFRVLKNKELKQFGEYRTRRLILEAWERLKNIFVGDSNINEART